MRKSGTLLDPVSEASLEPDPGMQGCDSGVNRASYPHLLNDLKTEVISVHTTSTLPTPTIPIAMALPYMEKDNRMSDHTWRRAVF